MRRLLCGAFLFGAGLARADTFEANTRFRSDAAVNSPRVALSLEPHSATVVVMMGLGQRDAIARVLADAGWAANTPAAVVLGASTAAAATWRGSLAELGGAALPEHDEAPGTIVIGAVAGLMLDALGSADSARASSIANRESHFGRNHVRHG